LKAGRQGPDLVLRVPVGTEVVEQESGLTVGDLDTEGARLEVASGGAGGRGNVHFKSPTNRTPRLAEPGRQGEERRLRLELKLIADVPGLIEGASTGAGLGLRFLRHLERTRLLVEVVDGSAPDPWRDRELLRAELRAYSEELARRPALTVVNKLDLPQTRRFQSRNPPVVGARHAPPLYISALTGEGVPELVGAIEEKLAAVAASAAALPLPDPPRPAGRELLPKRRSSRPVVIKRPWGYDLAGEQIQRLVERTDFDSPDSLQRFQVQLDRIGATAALEEAGARAGDTVRVGDLEFEYQP